MHVEKSPQETPCSPPPTVKKLLEQERKRKTASVSPSCSVTRASPAPLTTVPVFTPEPSGSTGASSSCSDMAVSYEQWTPVLDSTGPFSYSLQGASYAPAYSSPMVSSYITQPQIQGYDDTMMSQTYQECSLAAAPGPDVSCPPGFTWPPMGPGEPSSQVGFGSQVDATRLEEARMFLRGMDYSRTTDQDEDGDTILHIYTAKGLRECAFAAAERLRELGRLDAKEHMGKTALLVAVTANQPHIVQDLLLFGADVNTCDVKGQTALHMAAIYGLPRVLQVILSSGPGVNLEARDFEGLTPLHSAAISHGCTAKALCAAGLGDVSLQTKAGEKLSCLHMLLSAGASLLSQDIKSNKTALHLAVKEGDMELVRHLLRVPLPNMKEFVNMKAHGHTALHMAAGLHGNPHQEEMLRFLLSRGADPSVRNLENDQPAHMLQSGPRGKQLKLILKKPSASSRRRVASLQDQE